MTRISMGDMAQTFALRRQTTELKATLQEHLSEVTTGRPVDVARHLGGDFAALDGIDGSLARLAAFRSVTVEAGLFAGAAQAALSSIDAQAATLAPQMLSLATGGTTTGIDVAAADARQGFHAAVSALNTRAGDRSVFAGQATDGPALATADTILLAIEGAVAGATTPAGIEAATKAWFEDPAGFVALAYRGSNPLASLAVADGETASLTVTAADPALRDTLRGFAMAALLDRGTLDGAPAARADLMRRASETLMGAGSARAELSARVGLAEAAIEAARTRNEAESSALGIARAEMATVDPYAAATRLEETRGQLEAIYTLTARLSRLSLVDFLR